MRAAARSEALTTTQGPGVDGLLVQRKVGAVGHEGVREDPVVRFLALRNWAGLLCFTVRVPSRRCCWQVS